MAARLTGANGILVASGPWDPEPWAEAVRRFDPQRPVHIWPDLPDPSSVRYVLAWHPPAEAFASLPNLAARGSLGAGGEHVVARPGLPEVPLARIVSDDLDRMVEWVCSGADAPPATPLTPAARAPGEMRQPSAADVRVSVSHGRDRRGVGDAGHRLPGAGWSRRAKAVAGIRYSARPGSILARTLLSSSCR
jgi:glyoxylate/hydroxypyruvate reductase A